MQESDFICSSSVQWLEEDPWMLCGSHISRLKTGASGPVSQAAGKDAHWGGSVVCPAMLKP